MKRRFMFIVLLLALGAIVNVAVAWAFMFRFDAVGRHPTITAKGEAADWIADYRRSDDTIYNTVSGAAMGITVESVGSTQPWGKVREVMRTASRCLVGWPMASLSGGYWHVFAFNESDSKTHADHTFTVDAITFGDPDDGAFLPLKPLWPGFAINIIFYAMILWLILFAPFALRRKLRVRRGLCPGCAYPVGGSDVCTECGKPLSKRAVDE